MNTKENVRDGNAYTYEKNINEEMRTERKGTVEYCMNKDMEVHKRKT